MPTCSADGRLLSVSSGAGWASLASGRAASATPASPNLEKSVQNPEGRGCSLPATTQAHSTPSTGHLAGPEREGGLCGVKCSFRDSTVTLPRPHPGAQDPGDRKRGDPGAETACVASGQDVEEIERGQEL